MPEPEDRDLGLEWRRFDTFVVKILRADDGLSGLVQHVRTGERQRFEGLASLGEAIGRMSRGQSS